MRYAKPVQRAKKRCKYKTRAVRPVAGAQQDLPDHYVVFAETKVVMARSEGDEAVKKRQSAPALRVLDCRAAGGRVQ